MPPTPPKDPSAREYWELFDEAPVPYVVVGADARVAHANQAACAFFACGAEELVGRDVLSMYAPGPEGQEKARRVLARFQEEGKVEGVLLKYAAADGSYRWGQLTAVAKRDDGRVVASRSLIVDVTGRQEAIAAGEEARTMFESLLDAAPDGMVIVDEEATITLVNEQTERLFGYTREELVGQKIEVLVPEPLRERHVGHRDAYMEDPRSRPMGADLDLQGRRQDGSTFPVEISLSPVDTEEGRVVIAAVRDITRRREAEKREARARRQQAEIERLQERDDFKTQFINNAAHELNTPLTTLMMQVEILKRKAHGVEGLDDTLTMLERNADRFATLVGDLLDAGRYQGGRLMVDLQRLDLCALVHDVAKAHGPTLEAEGLRLDVDVEKGIFVEGDAQRLHQVLDNLLTNAGKFTPEGGSVHLRLGVEDDEAVVVVRDTGPGFDPSETERIFEPFTRLESGAAAPPGTGLGLYLCRAITALHRGTVEAYTEGPGTGATFTVRLPLP